jgi:hypothetical protein
MPRIISEFSDYYDSIAHSYFDKDDKIWLRKSEGIDSSSIDISKLPDNVRCFPPIKLENYSFIDQYAVLFCGKAYVYYEISGVQFFSIDAIKTALGSDEMIRKTFKGKKMTYSLPYPRSGMFDDQIIDYISKLGSRTGPRGRDFLNEKLDEANKIFSLLENPSKMPDDLFREHNTPIFWLNFEQANNRRSSFYSTFWRWGKNKADFKDNVSNFKDEVIFHKNYKLIDAGFAKVLDAASAYQEIEMYFSNNLAQQIDPVPERTQELIRDQHGFDKYSFKQVAPGERKARRKNKK